MPSNYRPFPDPQRTQPSAPPDPQRIAKEYDDYAAWLDSAPPSYRETYDAEEMMNGAAFVLVMVCLLVFGTYIPVTLAALPHTTFWPHHHHQGVTPTTPAQQQRK